MAPQFVLVTARREQPSETCDSAELSAVLEAEEWAKLELLAAALPVDCVWTAQRVEGQGHRSTQA